MSLTRRVVAEPRSPLLRWGCGRDVGWGVALGRDSSVLWATPSAEPMVAVKC